jgi:hypothetical protein
MRSNPKIPSALRISIIVLGYLISIAGALSIFSGLLPFFAPLLFLTAGGAVVALGSGPDFAAPRLNWCTGLVCFAGSAVILGVLNLIGADKVRHWTPHPAGYQIVWWICVCLFQHLPWIFRHDPPSPQAA